MFYLYFFCSYVELKFNKAWYISYVFMGAWVDKSLTVLYSCLMVFRLFLTQEINIQAICQPVMAGRSSLQTDQLNTETSNFNCWINFVFLSIYSSLIAQNIHFSFVIGKGFVVFNNTDLAPSFETSLNKFQFLNIF